eukprot:2243249-Prymnesium_polylepis.2
MSNNDLAVHLHFALFDNSGGYLLKPPEMRMDRSGGWQEEDGESERNRSLGSQSSADDCTPQSRANSVGSERKGSANSPGEGNGRTTVGSEQKGSARSTSERRGSARSTSERRGSARSTSERNLSLGTAASGSDFDLRSHSGPSGSDRAYADAYWPPPRNKLHRAMVRLLSLHHLPKVSATVVSLSHRYESDNARTLPAFGSAVNIDLDTMVRAARVTSTTAESSVA